MQDGLYVLSEAQQGGTQRGRGRRARIVRPFARSRLDPPIALLLRLVQPFPDQPTATGSTTLDRPAPAPAAADPQPLRRVPPQQPIDDLPRPFPSRPKAHPRIAQLAWARVRRARTRRAPRTARSGGCTRK
jgi:hypothetical protein